MNSKIGPTPRNAPNVGTHLKAAPANRYLAYETYRSLKAVVCLSLLLLCLNAQSTAQAGGAQAGGAQAAGAQTAPAPNGEVYAGIELSSEGVRAIALRVSKNEEESGLKLIYSEHIRLALARSGDGQITPQA